MIRKRSPGVYVIPSKSSKSLPFVIVTIRPAGERARISSAIESNAVTIASARRATTPPTARTVRAFTRTATVSERRSWCASRESRRSAIQWVPSARFTAAPTRCTEPGGDVVITTSIFSARAMRSAAGIAVMFHVAASSGTTSRRGSSRACVTARSRPRLPCSSSEGLRPLGPT